MLLDFPRIKRPESRRVSYAPARGYLRGNVMFSIFRRRAAPAASVISAPAVAHRFITIDVETANRDNHTICQIGIAAVDPDGSISTWGTLVDPGCHFDAVNTGIHGITAEDVRGAPRLVHVIEAIGPLLQGHPVIQHSRFDEQAILAGCSRGGITPPRIRWHDSVQIARAAWPDLRHDGGYGLANLREVFGLEFDHHDAIEDARATAQIVLLAEGETGLTFDQLAGAQASSASAARKQRNFAPHVTVEGNPAGVLAGHVAVFTGALSISREDAALLAASAGVTVKATVTRQTTLLIVGEQDLALTLGHMKSSKHRRADELIATGQPIRIIGEREFIALVGAQ